MEEVLRGLDEPKEDDFEFPRRPILSITEEVDEQGDEPCLRPFRGSDAQLPITRFPPSLGSALLAEIPVPERPFLPFCVTKVPRNKRQSMLDRLLGLYAAFLCHLLAVPEGSFPRTVREDSSIRAAAKHAAEAHEAALRTASAAMYQASAARTPLSVSNIDRHTLLLLRRCYCDDEESQVQHQPASSPPPATTAEVTDASTAAAAGRKPSSPAPADSDGGAPCAPLEEHRKEAGAARGRKRAAPDDDAASPDEGEQSVFDAVLAYVVAVLDGFCKSSVISKEEAAKVRDRVVGKVMQAHAAEDDAAFLATEGPAVRGLCEKYINFVKQRG